MKAIPQFLIVIFAAIFTSNMVNATILYEEDFNTPSANLADVLTDYSLTTSPIGGYSFFGWDEVSSAYVDAGTLAIEPTNGSQGSLDIGTFGGDLTITAGITARGDGGSINAGIRVGNNNYIFHPGFLLGEGAFRVDRADGFQNHAMGFIPSTDIFHTMVIDIVTDVFTSVNITVTDGVSGNVYEYDNVTEPWFGYRDTDYNPAGEVIGLTAGGAAGNFALFDYIRIETNASAVPAPASVVLFALGLAWLLARLQSR